MTNLFRASNWVSESKDSIISRGVTTCASITAHTVVLAQTRVGFLTRGRQKSFLDLVQDEQAVQMEEAYARATVAITRARALPHHGSSRHEEPAWCCYGDGCAHVWWHVWTGRANVYLHDHELCRPPFFLNYAARVITTVAVIELCYNCYS